MATSPPLIYCRDRPNHGILLPDEEEMRHLKALRIRQGERVEVTDGQGKKYTTVLISEQNKIHLMVEKEEAHFPRHPSLHIAIAPTKNTDRMDWFVEKSVEIGIDAIHLIECDHSERTRIKTERLIRVAVSAMKQSERYFLPQLFSPIPFQAYLVKSSGDQKFIAHCRNEENKKALRSVFQKGKNTTILIGPEGDFSYREIGQAEQAGFIPVSLGTTRLRTETAGIVAAHTFEILQF